MLSSILGIEVQQCRIFSMTLGYLLTLDIFLVFLG